MPGLWRQHVPGRQLGQGGKTGWSANKAVGAKADRPQQVVGVKVLQQNGVDVAARINRQVAVGKGRYSSTRTLALPHAA